MNRRKTKILGLVLTMAIAFCLAGCEQEIHIPTREEITENINVVSEDGTVISYMVADFEKDYYVASELEEMILEELVDFNLDMQNEVPKDRQPAILNGTHTSNGKIVVEYTFATGKVYGQYQLLPLDCYTGTVSGAVKAGYLKDMKLFSVKKGKALDLTTNEKILEKQIVICQGSTPMFVLSNPEYISANVTISEDMHTLEIQGAEGEYGFCIMK